MLRIGIDFGGTKIAYGLYDNDMRLLDRLRVKTDAEAQPEAVMDAMARDVRALMDQAGYPMADLAGIGIGFPSHISYEQGSVLIATNLPLWEDVALRDELGARLGVPVWVDNDTNCAALAEHRLGAGQGARHMAYMTVSTGVGCGFILNGEMYRGTHGFAGELGQMFVSDREGFGTRRMNAGVVQSISSGPAMVKLAQARIAEGRRSTIPAHAGTADAIMCEHIGAAYAEGDALAAEIVEHAVLYLGRTLVNLYELMDIGVIVYGGGVLKIGPRLVDGMIEVFYSLSHGAKKCPVDFRPAALGDDAGLIGAGLMVE